MWALALLAPSLAASFATRGRSRGIDEDFGCMAGGPNSPRHRQLRSSPSSARMPRRLEASERAQVQSRASLAAASVEKKERAQRPSRRALRVVATSSTPCFPVLPVVSAVQRHDLSPVAPNLSLSLRRTHRCQGPRKVRRAYEQNSMTTRLRDGWRRIRRARTARPRASPHRRCTDSPCWVDRRRDPQALLNASCSCSRSGAILALAQISHQAPTRAIAAACAERGGDRWGPDPSCTVHPGPRGMLWQALWAFAQSTAAEPGAVRARASRSDRAPAAR